MKSVVYLFIFFSGTLFSMQDISFKLDYENENDILITAKKGINECGALSFTVGNNKENIPSQIFSLRVKKEFQNNGIGSELFIKTVNHCKKNNSSIIRWDATFESIHFYKKFNARIIDQSIGDLLIGGNAEMEFDFTKDGNPRINRFNQIKEN